MAGWWATPHPPSGQELLHPMAGIEKFVFNFSLVFFPPLTHPLSHGLSIFPSVAFSLNPLQIGSEAPVLHCLQSTLVCSYHRNPIGAHDNPPPKRSHH